MDAQSIINDVTAALKKWTKQRKAEVRRASAEAHRGSMYVSRNTAREKAWEVMPAAYEKVSDGGTLPAHARQIMYACRGEIQNWTGEPLSDSYFTQTLLPDYMNEHLTETADWDVVFDARGHFLEPHTGLEVPLGTLQVRHYLGGNETDRPVVVRGLFPTRGPENRFSAVLFIEKEGFLPLLHRVQLAERYDLAIMSTKGMSVVAARSLVDELCGRHGVPLLVLHDLDKSGFSILGTLTRDNRRYTFRNKINVIDLGLRLDDVRDCDLEPEDAYYRGEEAKLRRNLRDNGANKEEVKFLLKDRQRVELNAFTSRAFVDWLEGKLAQHKVKKVLPDPDVLEEAYRHAFVRELVKKAVRESRKQAKREAVTLAVPDKLQQQVAEELKRSPHLPWDRAVARLVKTAISEGGDSAS
jgi:hypothetical protein